VRTFRPSDTRPQYFSGAAAARRNDPKTRTIEIIDPGSSVDAVRWIARLVWLVAHGEEHAAWGG